MIHQPWKGGFRVRCFIVFPCLAFGLLGCMLQLCAIGRQSRAVLFGLGCWPVESCSTLSICYYYLYQFETISIFSIFISYFYILLRCHLVSLKR
jgi:hypothetical protein